MADENWQAVENHQTKYHSLQLSDSGNTKIVIAHQRLNGQPFPYLLVFNETVNPDHWIGGRRRFGHGHQVRFDMFYFDPEGQGDFLTGEELRWLPHYGSVIPRKREGFNLDDQLMEHLNKLPNKDLFSSILRSEPKHSASERDVLERTGVPFENLFEHYQDPSVLAEQREMILAQYKKNWERSSIHFHTRGSKEEKPYEPTFDLNSSFDKKEYLLAIIKKASGFDIHTAPEEVGSGFEGAGMGFMGMVPFPGPLGFLEGNDKEDRPSFHEIDSSIVYMTRIQPEGVGTIEPKELGLSGKLEVHNSPSNPLDLSNFNFGEMLKKLRESFKTSHPFPEQKEEKPDKENSEE